MTIVGDAFTILSGISLALALALARVINYAPRVMLQIVVLFTDDPRGIIYNCNMFIVQDTDQLKNEILDREHLLKGKARYS